MFDCYMHKKHAINKVDAGENIIHHESVYVEKVNLPFIGITTSR